MIKNNLPSEILSLIHHVKLNETGWWDKAFQSIIISIIGNNNNEPVSVDRLLELCRDKMGPFLDQSRFIKHFEYLQSTNKIINIDSNLYCLNQTNYSEYLIASEEQSQIEIEAFNMFQSLTLKHCPNLEPKELWKKFIKTLIVPLMKSIGVKVYTLFNNLSHKNNFDDLYQLTHFFDEFGKSNLAIKALVLDFLDFQNSGVKKYILRLLNYYFFVEATNLNQETLDKIYSLSKSQSNLKIFVDTNFLLTILDLHDNPSNEATYTMLNLIKEIENKVKLKFYVTSITISEFHNLIGKFKEYIKTMKPSLNQAKAVEQQNEMSGIVRKYFTKCVDADLMIDPEEYFEAYLNNTIVYLRSKGVELYNENIDRYATDQRVIDDLIEQVDYRFSKIYAPVIADKLLSKDAEHDKLKIQEKFFHDCKLWYVVKDRRPTFSDSPKDISDWIITLDFKFLEFDRYKQKIDEQCKISVCLHPNEFISMLQFWVPRTETFENAILENFRMPLLFKEIDDESERISLEILRTLSQYEESKDFSKDLISEILINKSIRHKIRPSNSVEKNAELLKEEIFKLFQESTALLSKEKTYTSELKGELVEVRHNLTSLTNKIDTLSNEQKKLAENRLIDQRKMADVIIQAQYNETKIRLDSLNLRIDDINKLKDKALLEFKNYKSTLNYKLRKLFSVDEKVYDVNIQKDIENKYFDEKYLFSLNGEKEQTERTLLRINPKEIQENEKIIVYCENQNAKLLNMLGFERLSFIPEKDSSGVYVKIVSDITCFGIRDRDYLMNKEIEKLQTKHSNYKILEYYCFENYLYHPENINELGIEGFSKDEYLKDIVDAKNNKRDQILTNIKKSRDSYQEFRLPDNGIKLNNEVEIINDLKSDDIEIFFKYFSMKDHYNKIYLAKYNLEKELLISTNWFKTKISNLLVSQKK